MATSPMYKVLADIADSEKAIGHVGGFEWSADHSNPLHNQLPSGYHSHKASYSNFSPKIGCHGNVPQHLWTSV